MHLARRRPWHSGVFLRGSSYSVFCKRRIERTCRRFEIQSSTKGRALRCSVNTIHTTVFPFHTQGSRISNVIQSHDDGFKVHHTATDTAEVPVSTRVTETGVAAKGAHRAVAFAPPDIFHMHIADPLREGP